MKDLQRGLLVVLFTSLSSSLLAAPPAGTNSPLSTSLSEWRLIGGNQYEQHYSELTQVNDKNVGNLKLAWYADMPTDDGLTGVPIVAAGVVYQSGALGKAWANDLRTGKLLWSFDAGIKFPLGVIPSWGARLSRGLAIWEDKVLKATGDCRLFALDRKTGHKLWEAQSCDPAAHKTITGAPRVGDGKVFIGIVIGKLNSGAGEAPVMAKVWATEGTMALDRLSSSLSRSGDAATLIFGTSADYKTCTDAAASVTASCVASLPYVKISISGELSSSSGKLGIVTH